MNGPGRLIGRRRRQAGRDDRASGSPPVEHAPDDLLLAAMSAGDSNAALTFVRRFQRIVYGVAFAALGDRGFAEDVAQQAFEHAWRQANLYDPRRGTVRAWLIGIARNLAVDTARMRRPTPVNPPELTNLVKAIADSAEHHVLIGETAAELAEALAGLPPEQARAAVMAAAHGFTAREIAQTEGIPVATAKSRIRLALDKLHAALPAQGERTPSEHPRGRRRAKPAGWEERSAGGWQAGEAGRDGTDTTRSDRARRRAIGRGDHE